MFILKSTYNNLFDLFIKEKQGSLDFYKRNQELQQVICKLEKELRKCKRS